MRDTEMRANFEAWAVRSASPLVQKREVLARSQDGRYQSFIVESNWQTWQAALAAAPVASQEPGQTPEQIAYMVATAPAPGARQPDDAARLDYIEEWRRKGVAKGYKWDSFYLHMGQPIRKQLDDLINGKTLR